MREIAPNEEGYSYRSDGYFTTGGINQLLAGLRAEGDAMLVHAVCTKDTGALTFQELITYFPANVQSMFMHFERGHTKMKHYKSIVFAGDVWYEVDSLDVGAGLPPKPMVSDADWRSLLGDLYFFAALDPWLYGEFGYVPRELRRYFPADKTTLPLANFDALVLSEVVVRKPCSRGQYEDLYSGRSNDNLVLHSHTADISFNHYAAGTIDPTNGGSILNHLQPTCYEAELQSRQTATDLPSVKVQRTIEEGSIKQPGLAAEIDTGVSKVSIATSGSVDMSSVLVEEMLHEHKRAKQETPTGLKVHVKIVIEY